MASCCAVIGGKPCGCDAPYRANPAQLNRTQNEPRAKCKGKLSFDAGAIHDEHLWVCDEHAFDVIKAHIGQLQAEKGGSLPYRQRDMVQGILKATGTHEDSLLPAKTSEGRHRVSTDKPPAQDEDLLSEVFKVTRPYIQNPSFIYALFMTMLRAVLILNHIYTFGRLVWHGDKEGTDVLRFCAVLYVISGASTIDMLRGGAVAKNAETLVDGKFNMLLRNVPGIPSPRQLRNYIASAFRIYDVLAISEPMVDAALCALGGPDNLLLGATFDCVYGESFFEVVKDLDGKHLVLGGGSAAGPHQGD